MGHGLHVAVQAQLHVASDLVFEERLGPAAGELEQYAGDRQSHQDAAPEPHLTRLGRADSVVHDALNDQRRDQGERRTEHERSRHDDEVASVGPHEGPETADQVQATLGQETALGLALGNRDRGRIVFGGVVRRSRR